MARTICGCGAALKTSRAHLIAQFLTEHKHLIPQRESDVYSDTQIAPDQLGDEDEEPEDKSAGRPAKSNPIIGFRRND